MKTYCMIINYPYADEFKFITDLTHLAASLIIALSLNIRKLLILNVLEKVNSILAI